MNRPFLSVDLECQKVLPCRANWPWQATCHQTANLDIRSPTNTNIGTNKNITGKGDHRKIKLTMRGLDEARVMTRPGSGSNTILARLDSSTATTAPTGSHAKEPVALSFS